MEIIRSHWLPWNGHCSSHKLVSVPYKVTLRNLEKTTFSSCSLQNNSNSLRLAENPSEESTYSRRLLTTKSVVDVSKVNRIIKEYTEDGCFEDAIRVYLDFIECGFPVEEFRFFPCLIKAFGGLYDVKKGKQIHGHLLKFGFLQDIFVKNSLLGMYWKCGASEDAVGMFERMEKRDSVSWNTMISGFCQSGEYVKSLVMFRRMITECGGSYHNRVACLAALSSCASIKCSIHGLEIHGFLVKNGLDSDEFLVSGLIEMYMKCGDIKNAENVFERIRDNELVGREYGGMECNDLGLLDLAVGKQIHGLILSLGLDDDVRVGTALMEMYFKCGDPETSLQIFKRSRNYNLVMWGSVMLNCAQNGYPNEALQFFSEFMLDCGFPDPVILLAALRACSFLSLKPRGMAIHGFAIKMGFDSDVFVGGALVDFYGKCGDMEYAQQVFHGLSTRDLVSWNALISGFAQNKCADEALKAFRDMQSKKIKPNTVTMACILSVCTHLSVMILCKEVHCYLLRHWFETNALVNNSLISAYAKCGDIRSSWTVFEKLPVRNEVTWNSILLGFGMHGCTDEMFATFEKMKKTNIKPDHGTFTSLLSTCSHSVHHQAYDLIMSMPCSPDDRIWGSLLASCKNHGNTKLAEVAANHIFELDPSSVGYRVLLTNLYEDSGNLNEVFRVRTEMKQMGLKKQPGCSWIEVSNSMHIFVAGDYSHDQSEDIYATIESLSLEMKRVGYVPHIQAASNKYWA
uniref:DYW domain-containing protein n=1 Tax=Salix viminalis TaxID=40686 RepID=A0A6N2MPW0_SALVM